MESRVQLRVKIRMWRLHMSQLAANHFASCFSHNFLNGITIYCHSVFSSIPPYSVPTSVLLPTLTFTVSVWIIATPSPSLISFSPFSSSAVVFCSLTEKWHESAQVEGVSKVEEKRSETESTTGEDHCTDSNGSVVSDELVSLATAWASFVKPRAGWY